MIGRRRWLAALLGWPAASCGKRLPGGFRPAKVVSVKRLFSVSFGEGPGRLHYRPNRMGIELDRFPGEFVRDREGNFVFLEAAPFARVCRVAPSGEFLAEFSVPAQVSSFFPSATVAPHWMFAAADGSLAILLTVAAADSTDAHLLFTSAEGVLKKLVALPELETSLVATGSAELDDSGYLWALHAGGPTEVYAPDGTLYSEFQRQGSFVDRTGVMYTLDEPIRLCDRKGREITELAVEFTDNPPPSIDGGHKRVVFHVRQGEESYQQGRWIKPWSLDLFRVDKTAGKLTFVRELAMPETILAQPNLGVDIVYRRAVWGPRLLLEPDGSLYLLGRSEEACWMTQIETGVY